MRSRHCASFVVALALFQIPLSAWADSNYDRAVKLEASGNLEAALAAFEAMVDPDVAVRLHIGRCKRQLHRLLEAERVFRAVLVDPAADKADRELADAALRELDAKIPRLRIEVSAQAGDLVATLDSKAVAVPGVFRLDPGEHVVRATRGGELVFERRLVLAEGDAREMLVAAPSAESAARPTSSPAGPNIHIHDTTGPVAVATAPGATIDQSTHNHYAISDRFTRAAPFLIAGATLGVTTLILAGLRQSEVTTFRDACAHQIALTCDRDAAGEAKIKKYETWTYISGWLAAGSFVVGGVLFALPIAAPTKERKGYAMITPTVGGLALRGGF